jgi:hypothetical protein
MGKYGLSVRGTGEGYGVKPIYDKDPKTMELYKIDCNLILQTFQF